MYLTTEIKQSAMPKMLVAASQVAQEACQCDMLYLSLLTMAGYAMPNYVVQHGVPAHEYHPNLMTLVVAPPASGKGIMNLSKQLVMPIHKELRKKSEILALLAVAQKSPEATPELTAFIPGNCSNNAFLQLLLDNDGRGVMLETEMDVLSQTWRRDYGNYSAAFRQAFEHETISKARKMQGEGFVEVPHPELSVLLSGTMNQLKPLLQSKENGLASRFVCYSVEKIVPFREEVIIKQGEENGEDVGALYAEIGEEMQRMYHWLNGQKTTCEYRLTAKQADQLRDVFSTDYMETMELLEMPLTFDPVMKRLVVSVLRIGMIVRMLRYWEDEVSEKLANGEKVDVPEVLECTDEEFEALVTIAEVLVYHAITVHGMLPEEDELHVEKTTDPSSELLERMPNQFTTAEAKAEGEKMGIAARTVERYIQNWTGEKQIVNLKKGFFRKL